ncbi:class F sortase [Rhodococcus sp. ABRD24]|uniref:class F sortase n=1 Tax=Rhodococcus sp. ABRD24 TaxID=2507582 RepID=UPI001F60F73E|nr:class F sortase [Rhodococcus sp. ABRD24]
MARCPRSRRTGPAAFAAACFAVVLVVTGCGSAGSPTRVPVPAAVVQPDNAAVMEPTAQARPVRIQAPAIGLDSGLIDLGLNADGTLEVPPEGFPAGWYSGSPVPGEVGPAVVAGHVDWAGSPGVFHRLHDLLPGDAITVTRADGAQADFRVTAVEDHAKSAFPTARVYGDLDHPGLRLITCGGEFDSGASTYRDNTVVFADLVTASLPTTH